MKLLMLLLLSISMLAMKDSPGKPQCYILISGETCVNCVSILYNKLLDSVSNKKQIQFYIYDTLAYRQKPIYFYFKSKFPKVSFLTHTDNQSGTQLFLEHKTTLHEEVELIHFPALFIIQDGKTKLWKYEELFNDSGIIHFSPAKEAFLKQ